MPTERTLRTPRLIAGLIPEVSGGTDPEVGHALTEYQQLIVERACSVIDSGLDDGEQLVLPHSVVGYLDRLRALGVGESYVEMERDAWIMIAAQVPDETEEIIRGKHRDLDNPTWCVSTA